MSFSDQGSRESGSRARRRAKATGVTRDCPGHTETNRSVCQLLVMDRSVTLPLKLLTVKGKSSKSTDITRYCFKWHCFSRQNGRVAQGERFRVSMAYLDNCHHGYDLRIGRGGPWKMGSVRQARATVKVGLASIPVGFGIYSIFLMVGGSCRILSRGIPWPECLYRKIIFCNILKLTVEKNW